MKVLLAALFLAGSCFGQTACTTYFSVVWKDTLNNVKQGLSKDDAKWMQDKMQKKYPGICYAAPGPSVHLVLWIGMEKATYHGTRTERETHSEPIDGTVTDQNGNISNVSGSQQVTTTTTVPDTFDYPILTLSVLQRHDGKWTGLHNFQRKGICHTMYGIPIHCKTGRYILEDAIKWIQKGGLDDPLQSVVGQEKQTP